MSLEEKALAVTEGVPLPAVQMEMGVEDIVARVTKIHDIMNRVMVKDVHYGKVPGVSKDFLFKAGAEILGTTFKITPKYEIERFDLPNGHREYEIKTRLYHMETGQFLGEGVGSCSTMESKYRYREDKKEINTGNPIPGEYWNIRKKNPDQARGMLGTKHYPKKTEEGWFIFRSEGTGEKVENPDIADCYNTVKKISRKRSFVDAIISVCSASDVFTQDEDIVVGDGYKEESGVGEGTKGDGKKTTERDVTPEEDKKTTEELEKEKAELDKLKKKTDGLVDKMAEAGLINHQEYEQMHNQIQTRRSVAGKSGMKATAKRISDIKTEREKAMGDPNLQKLKKEVREIVTGMYYKEFITTEEFDQMVESVKACKGVGGKDGITALKKKYAEIMAQREKQSYAIR